MTIWEKLELALTLVGVVFLGVFYALISGAWTPPLEVERAVIWSSVVVMIVGRFVRVRTRMELPLGTDALDLHDRPLLLWRVVAFVSAPVPMLVAVSAEVLHRQPNPHLALACLAVSVVCTTALAVALRRRWWVWVPLSVLFAGIPALILAVQPRLTRDEDR